MGLRANPHLLEINARLWMSVMRKKYSSRVTLSTVPDEELLKIKHLGFDAVWLMGVWQTSPASRIKARGRGDETLVKNARKVVPGLDISKIDASPYAVRDYLPDPDLGDESEMKILRERMNKIGMKLLLDFVSNHLSIDNPYFESNPDYFVTAGEEAAGEYKNLFFKSMKNGKEVYAAYGRDPNYPPWTDTVQVNYYNPEAREKMTELLIRVSDMCDGVRCEMVMLTLSDVYENTWGVMLEREGRRKPAGEFWLFAIREVRKRRPDFVFLAEVYWGLEWRLQQMGFDYTYDKVIYDRLKASCASDVRGHLRVERLYQKRSARFIDNHNEVPSLKSFGEKKSMAAAVVISTIKGLRFFYDAQLDGLDFKVPLNVTDFDYRIRMDVRKFYEKLLKIVDHPAFHGGEWSLIDTLPAGPEDKTNADVLSWSWNQRRTVKIVAVNYSESVSSAVLDVKFGGAGSLVLFEELSDRFVSFAPADFRNGLRIKKMPPYSFCIFDYEF